MCVWWAVGVVGWLAGLVVSVPKTESFYFITKHHKVDVSRMWWGCEGLIYLIARLMCVGCIYRTILPANSQLQFTEANTHINLRGLTYIILHQQRPFSLSYLFTYNICYNPHTTAYQTHLKCRSRCKMQRPNPEQNSKFLNETSLIQLVYALSTYLFGRHMEGSFF